MKRTIAFWAFAALLFPVVAHAQEAVVRATLAANFDLDGEAADDDQIVVSADLAASTTYTIAAQPDSCRLIDMTVTDANSSVTVGTVTLTGTDCLGFTRVCKFDFSVVATRGSGVKTIPVTTGPTGSSCYLANVTSIVSSSDLATAAAATDLVKVGYTSNSVNGWPVFGKLREVGPQGEHGVDVFGSYAVAGLPITTSGASSTTVTSVGSAKSFTYVSAGDLLLINHNGRVYERKVTARASADSITINAAINLPAAGVPFSYKKAFFTTDPTDEVWIPVESYKTALFTWRVDANANTGGVVTLLECAKKGPNWPGSGWTQISTTTVASGGTQANTAESINLELLPFQACRFGMKFGTGDDGDGADENISLGVTLEK